MLRGFPRSGSLLAVVAKRCRICRRTVATTSEDAKQRPAEDVSTLHVPPRPKLSVKPLSALADEPVKITVGGLERHQPVTLAMRVTSDHGNMFQSHGYYTSDGSGEVDLTRDASLGGCYDGIEPMGLFWASKISPHSERPYSRLGKKDVTTPQIVSVSVYEDHVKEDKFESLDPTDSLHIERWYMSNDVERIPLSGGSVEGVLFVPKSRGPFPGVIDLRGAIGDIMEFRPAMLASHGFVTLALRYKGYGGIGKTLKPMRMEYFENALNFLAEHDKVKGCGVGAVGISTGGAMVAAMAGLFPKLGCSVFVNGMIFAMERAVSYKDQVWEALSWDNDAIKKTDEMWIVKDAFTHPTGDEFDKYVMPFKNATSPILFLLSDDDGSINQDLLVSQVEESMRTVGNQNYEIVRYPGAGHLLEPPYTPLIPATYYSKELLIPILYGGKTKEHARAQEDSWGRIIHFLRSNLSAGPPG